MTKAQRTITTLLAVVAVLLAVNIAVSLNRQAEAQPQVEIAPSVTGLSVDWHSQQAYRVWSDGVIEARPCVFVTDPEGSADAFWHPGEDWEEIVVQP